MPDWVSEKGIGETRFARVLNGEIVEARILLEGTIPAGVLLDARLIEVGVPAVARVGAQQYLLPKGAPGITEGAAVRIEVTREKIPGAEPWKRPMARIADERAHAVKLDAEALPFPSPDDRFERAGWTDLLEEARDGIVRFDGGELRVSLTPAMTLIDVDGQLPLVELAIAAAKAAARTILRHSVGGSIGIDLPTISGKGRRQTVGAAIDAILPQPFERTAMNGFGFVQIVRPRTRASTFELASDRAAFEARVLLRKVAMERTGATCLVAHSAVSSVLDANPTWIEALAGQIGGAVILRSDPSLPIHGAYAQNA